LQGEKIDIIPWSQDIATFVVNALALPRSPRWCSTRIASASKSWYRTQLSLAIGRRGQNIAARLAATGWDIDIPHRQEESERRQAEFQSRTKVFMEALDVDEVVGQLLASEGFGSVEELAVVDEKELAGIEGFDEDTARELQTRAKEYLGKIESDPDAKRKELGVEDAVKDVPGVTTAMLVKFGEGGIKTVEDLAGCATDDLVGWTERKDGEEKATSPASSTATKSRARTPEAMIMQARLKAGWITEADLAQPAGGGRTGRSRSDAGVTDIAPMLARTPHDELDAGPRKGGPGTERLCALTRAVKPVDELIRFVVRPDGVVPDPQRKLPGRGLWITGESRASRTPDPQRLRAASKRELRVTPELVEQTERLLVRGALDALAIARGKPDWSPPDLPRSRRPSPTTPSWA
jgi:transcription termination factor NusA